MTPEVREVAKLVNSGVNDDVVLAYVTRSTNRFVLSPDDLIYLTDIGVSPLVLTTMQRKTSSGLLAGSAAGLAQPLVQPPTGLAAPAPAAGVSPPPTNPPAPAPQVVTPIYTSNPVPAYVTAPPAPEYEGPPPPVVGAPQQPVSMAYFQDALAPYGAWVDVDGYGRCWRPDYGVLGMDWRPYGDGGRWVWTDFGWYWVSDYPWGWATFHYGRWSRVSRHGWVWVPDVVWGPAWVCWRETGSHCGWAPLPPGATYYASSGWWYRQRSVGFDFGFGLGAIDFVFVPWSRFCERRPYHFYASQPHVASLYSDSRVANTTVVGHDRRVVFEGIGKSRVVQSSRVPVPQASLRESAWSAASAPRESLNQTTSGFVVQSPRVALPPASAASAAATSGRWTPAAATAAPMAVERGGAANRSPGLAADPLVGNTTPYIPSTRFVPPARPSIASPAQPGLPSPSLTAPPAAVTPRLPAVGASAAPVIPARAALPTLPSASVPAPASAPGLPVRVAGAAVTPAPGGASGLRGAPSTAYSAPAAPLVRNPAESAAGTRFFTPQAPSAGTRFFPAPGAGGENVGGRNQAFQPAPAVTPIRPTPGPVERISGLPGSRSATPQAPAAPIRPSGAPSTGSANNSSRKDR
jgi:hypothetical protein